MVLALIREILLVLATAYVVAYGLLPFLLFPTVDLKVLSFLALSVWLFPLMVSRGIDAMRDEAKEKGWPEAILRPALVASAVLCVRRLQQGHWF